MTRAERRTQAELLAGADLDDGRFEDDDGVCPECDGLGTDKFLGEVTRVGRTVRKSQVCRTLAPDHTI